MQTLLDQVKNLSVEELTRLNKFIVETVKMKRQLDGFKVANQLEVGMSVKIDHKSHANTKFTIQKLNRTKAVVTIEGSTTQYTVPFNMIIVE